MLLVSSALLNPGCPCSHECALATPRVPVRRADEICVAAWSLVTAAAAMGMFTWTKWEVERRIKEELDEEAQKSWFAGTFHATHAHELTEGFVAAEAFDGERPGFVFKHGRAGLGYYPDYMQQTKAAVEK